MTRLIDLPSSDEQGRLRVVVEAPRGSKVKLALEPELGVFLFDRALPLGVVYPFDWGFVPGTLAEDGDPLDAMVVFDGATWPGVVIPSRPIGVVRLVQRTRGKTTRNDRIVAVPCDDERLEDVRDLHAAVREELESFFVLVGEATKEKKVTIQGWRGAASARKLVDEAARTHASHATSARRRRPNEDR